MYSSLAQVVIHILLHISIDSRYARVMETDIFHIKLVCIVLSRSHIRRHRYDKGMPGKSSAATSFGQELKFDEMLRARTVWVTHTDEVITTPFELRTILSELGQYPQDVELNYCVEAFENKMNFNNFTTYLSFLKKRFMKPEPQDVDTLRAFVALGGGADRKGDINAENLRSACRHFDLTIDIDAMIREVDDDMSGKLEFSEFKSMWAGSAEAAQAAAAAEKQSNKRASGSFDMDVDEFLLSGTMRRPSNTAAAKNAAVVSGSTTPPNQALEEEDAPEEDQIELLKQHLFPNVQRKVAVDTRKTKHLSIQNAGNSVRGIPTLPPLRDTAITSANAGGSMNPNVRDPMLMGDGSDSDDGPDTTQMHTTYKGQYKPPSPVILSMRNVKPPAKLRSGRGSSPSTPRRNKIKSTGNTPRASPRR